jgi:alpha-L-fucosidase
LLIDIVSENGNLLLDVGPEADGTISEVQLRPLRALGEWLKVNGDAIYGTHPWKRAVGETDQGVAVRFTQKNSVVFATVLGQPVKGSISIRPLTVSGSSEIRLLGDEKPLVWTQQNGKVRIQFPDKHAIQHAYVLRITGSVT